MRQYLAFLEDIVTYGVEKADRTGTGTTSLFGYQMRFDLSEGFPLLTTKRMATKSIVHELLWFLSGSTNITYLKSKGVTIWDEWANKEGDLGPVYGRQWRRWYNKWGSIDQIANIISSIKINPDSRRHVVSAWNVSDIDKMALAPCHMIFQFYVSEGKLSCMVTQRSADAFLGVPFNIASYALLTHMIAQQCDLEVGELIWSGGDCHIYSNHMDQVDLQLSREPLHLCKLSLKKAKTIDDYTEEDIFFMRYASHPVIHAPIAV